MAVTFLIIISSCNTSYSNITLQYFWFGFIDTYFIISIRLQHSCTMVQVTKNTNSFTFFFIERLFAVNGSWKSLKLFRMQSKYSYFWIMSVPQNAQKLHSYHTCSLKTMKCFDCGQVIHQQTCLQEISSTHTVKNYCNLYLCKCAKSANYFLNQSFLQNIM